METTTKPRLRAARYSKRLMERVINDLKAIQLARQTPSDPLADTPSPPVPLCALCNLPFRTSKETCWFNVTTGYALPVLARGGYGYWEDIRAVHRPFLSPEEAVQEYAGGNHVLAHRRCLRRRSSHSTIAHAISPRLSGQFLDALAGAGIDPDELGTRWDEVRAIVKTVLERDKLVRIVRLYTAVSAQHQDRGRAERVMAAIKRNYGAALRSHGLTLP